MGKRETERPEGRIRERGRKRGDLEKIRGSREEREEFMSPKNKKAPQISGNMCLYCGTVFKTRDERATVCPSCTTAFSDS